MKAACGLQLWSSPASARVTLDQYVTRIEDNPIEMHGGKRGALSEAEKLLLEQQDELRQLRNRAAGSQQPRGKSSVAPAADPPAAEAPSLPPAPPVVEAPTPEPAAPPPPPAPSAPEASTPAPAPLPPLPEPKLDDVPTIPSANTVEIKPRDAPAESAPAQQEGGGLGAFGNLIGVVAAGVLGGLLYQSKKASEVAQEQFAGELQGREAEAAGLKAKFSEMERLAQQRAEAAERLQRDMESQRNASEAATRARDAAMAGVQREKQRADEDLQQREKLNEALQVEVRWADELRAKEQTRRSTVRFLAALSLFC